MGIFGHRRAGSTSTRRATSTVQGPLHLAQLSLSNRILDRDQIRQGSQAFSSTKQGTSGLPLLIPSESSLPTKSPEAEVRGRTCCSNRTNGVPTSKSDPNW